MNLGSCFVPCFSALDLNVAGNAHSAWVFKPYCRREVCLRRPACLDNGAALSIGSLVRHSGVLNPKAERTTFVEVD